jgi:hypothetical protein
LALFAAACGDCLAIQYAALEVEIVDATTGAPAAAGATILVVGPVTFRDSVTFPPDSASNSRVYEATGRDAVRGLYDVTVRKPGYRTWTRTGIRVTEEHDCGYLNTVSLKAELVPEP